METRSAYQPCSTCGFMVELNADYDSGLRCSSYCKQTDAKDKQKYKAAQPGDFCLWPCSVCGCVIDDEYVPGGWCSSCDGSQRIKLLTQVVRESLVYLPDDLRDKAKKLIS